MIASKGSCLPSRAAIRAAGDEQDPRDEHGQVIYDAGVTLLETWQALEP